MSQTLEMTKVNSVTDEEKRIAHNARNHENYRKLLSADCSDITGNGVEERSKERERAYPSLDAYRPLHARREITFEDVQIPEEIKRETQRRSVTQSATVAPSKFDYSDSIYTSSVYREAALRKERAASTMAETDDETLSMPTSTTLQYGTVQHTATNAQVGVATASKTAVSASEDMRAYYASLLKKVAVVLALTVTVLLVVIAVNSAILSGMNLEIAQLETTLSTLQSEIQALQQAISAETSWESILAFIQANGMIPSL